MRRSSSTVSVLHPVRKRLVPTDGTVANPYLELTIQSLPSDRVSNLYWSWSRAIFGRYDLLHLHWPDELAHASGRLQRWSKRFCLALLIFRIRATRVRVVRTVHNLEPHESTSGVSAALVGMLGAETSHWVVLNEVTPTPDRTRTTLIPHGHYRGWYRADPRSPQSGRLIVFGLIREYKGIDDFVRVFGSMPGKFSLCVAGRADDPQLAESLREAARGDNRVDLQTRFVPDAELAGMIMDAELVVLPYRQLHNSGAALLALSLGRPVVCPSSPTTERLASEFGNQWIITYESPLDPSKLADAVRRAQDGSLAGNSEPDLSARDWPKLGEALAAVYERVARCDSSHV